MLKPTGSKCWNFNLGCNLSCYGICLSKPLLSMYTFLFFLNLICIFYANECFRIVWRAFSWSVFVVSWLPSAQWGRDRPDFDMSPCREKGADFTTHHCFWTLWSSAEQGLKVRGLKNHTSASLRSLVCSQVYDGYRSVFWLLGLRNGCNHCLSARPVGNISILSHFWPTQCWGEERIHCYLLLTSWVQCLMGSSVVSVTNAALSNGWRDRICLSLCHPLSPSSSFSLFCLCVFSLSPSFYCNVLNFPLPFKCRETMFCSFCLSSSHRCALQSLLSLPLFTNNFPFIVIQSQM